MACARWTIGENSPSVLKPACKKWREEAHSAHASNTKKAAPKRDAVTVWYCSQHHVCMHSDFSQHADKWMCKICAQSADRPEFLFSRHDLFSFDALSSICIVYCLRQVNGLIGAAHKVKSRRDAARETNKPQKWPAIILCHCRRCDAGPLDIGRCAIKIRNHSSVFFFVSAAFYFLFIIYIYIWVVSTPTARKSELFRH